MYANGLTISTKRVSFGFEAIVKNERIVQVLWWRDDMNNGVWICKELGSWFNCYYVVVIVVLGWRLLYPPIHEPRCGGGWSLILMGDGNNTEIWLIKTSWTWQSQENTHEIKIKRREKYCYSKFQDIYWIPIQSLYHQGNIVAGSKNLAL